MTLLREELPLLSINPGLVPSEFLDRCEEIAKTQGYAIDRRRAYAGPGFDQLNLHLVSTASDELMVRMVVTPQSKGRINADVVAHGKWHTRRYDDYMAAAKEAYDRLFAVYARAHGKKLRLGVPRRLPHFDPNAVDCGRIRYAHEKFSAAIRGMAVGAGDARDRMRSAFMTFHTIRPSDLPAPLDRHLQWVYDQLTRKPARYRLEGTLDSTLAQMKNSTASKIAERVLAITDAIEELLAQCENRNDRAT